MITSQKFFANKRKKAHTLRRVKEDLNEAYERAKLVEEDDSDDTDVSQ